MEVVECHAVFATKTTEPQQAKKENVHTVEVRAKDSYVSQKRQLLFADISKFITIQSPHKHYDVAFVSYVISFISPNGLYKYYRNVF